MALNLRAILEEELDISPMPDTLIPDSALSRYYNEVGKFYFNYRRGVKGIAFITVDSSGTFDFTTQEPVPETIIQICDAVTGATISSSQWSYLKPILTISPGDYQVTFYKNVEQTSVDEFPSYLYQELWVARCKKGIGQRMKFSKFNEPTLELDGEAMYTEGSETYEERREFTIINRDELEFPPEVR